MDWSEYASVWLRCIYILWRTLYMYLSIHASHSWCITSFFGTYIYLTSIISSGWVEQLVFFLYELPGIVFMIHLYKFTRGNHSFWCFSFLAHPSLSILEVLQITKCTIDMLCISDRNVERKMTILLLMDDIICSNYGFGLEFYDRWNYIVAS